MVELVLHQRSWCCPIQQAVTSDGEDAEEKERGKFVSGSNSNKLFTRLATAILNLHCPEHLSRWCLESC